MIFLMILNQQQLTDELEANWFDELKCHPQKPSLIEQLYDFGMEAISSSVF